MSYTDNYKISSESVLKQEPIVLDETRTLQADEINTQTEFQSAKKLLNETKEQQRQSRDKKSSKYNVAKQIIKPSLASSSSPSTISNYFQKKNSTVTNGSSHTAFSQVKQEGDIDFKDENLIVDLTQTGEKTSTQAVPGKPYNTPFISPIRVKPELASRSSREDHTRSAAIKRKKDTAIVPKSTSFTPPAALKSFQFTKSNKFKLEPKIEPKLEPKAIEEVVNDTIMIDDDDEDFEADFKKAKQSTTNKVVSLPPPNLIDGLHLKCVHCQVDVCRFEVNGFSRISDEYLGYLPRKIAIFASSLQSTSLFVVEDDMSKATVQREMATTQAMLSEHNDALCVNCFLDDLGQSWQYLECRRCLNVIGYVLRTASSPDSKFFQMFNNKPLLLITN